MLEFLRGRDVLVAGWGISGRSLVEPLRDIGARPVVTDGGAAALAEAAGLGLDIATCVELETTDWSRFALVITSPGWRPDSPVLAAAVAEGTPVWGDVEFAWWVDQARIYGPVRKWLVVTGTNGKTTTTQMTHAILRAAGIPSVACGNIGLPILDALRRNPGPQVLAVELSSFQLHWAPSVRPEAGVVLNVAEDHLDWHGGLDAYAAAKARALVAGSAWSGSTIRWRPRWPVARKPGAPSASGSACPPTVSSAWSTANCSTARSPRPRSSPRSATSARPARPVSPTRSPRPR
ncbi:hypothetical protein NN4_44220 [Nocardia ninae NBRC 108245]|uniref:Mur ligase central domain-containing protein n=1 Tax=Nocardia ninae NBRC 108245 TaxID=1210091 RepID=A0A511MGT5_9NOCA|nr:hypothetical protein NN4_44220 [Nocardia ninae NBRC 108245]